MAIKIYQAKDTGRDLYYQIWLDDTKELMVPEVDEDGEPVKDDDGQPVLVASRGVPDPEWLREWRWGKVDGEGLPISRIMIQEEVALLADVERRKMNAASTVVTLPEEGTRLILN